MMERGVIVEDPTAGEAPLPRQAALFAPAAVQVTVRNTGRRWSFQQNCPFGDITDSLSVILDSNGQPCMANYTTNSSGSLQFSIFSPLFTAADKNMVIVLLKQTLLDIQCVYQKKHLS